MKEGMLWYNDSEHSLAEKVALATVRYRKKHGVLPNACFVHPSALEDGAVEMGGVRVMAKPTVLLHHFWLGVEERSDDKD